MALRKLLVDMRIKICKKCHREFCCNAGEKDNEIPCVYANEKNKCLCGKCFSGNWENSCESKCEQTFIFR